MTREIDSLLWRALEAPDLPTYDAARLTNPDSKERSIIGDGVHFSRRFILSYNVVLLCILISSALLYWSPPLLRTLSRYTSAKPSRAISADAGVRSSTNASSEETPSSGGSLSGSSSTTTLETTSKIAKEEDGVNEASPLLGIPTAKSHVTSMSVLRAWLMYQPSNIPIFNKSLPSNAASLAISSFLGLNVFYLLYRVPFALPHIFVLADRAGLLFVANLPLLYILAAKNQPVKWLTGYSYESLNIIHRRLGEWMCLLALVHFLGMVETWYLLLSSRISFSAFLSIKLVWLGVLSFLSYETLYMTSLGTFRQRFYELFLGLHVILQASALGFLFFHHPASRPYVGIALGVFVIDRLIFRLFLTSRSFRADLSILEDDETVLLSSDWDIGRASWWSLYNIQRGWKPTEHVFLTVPALSRKHVIQAHPFTIASAAPDVSTAETTHAWLSLIIRARDGFSRDLLLHAKSHRSVNVRIDGPYGSTHALNILRNSENAVIVAGGSGIAVAYPLLFDIIASASGSDDAEAGAYTKRQVTLIWIVHDAQHIEWIGRSRLDDLCRRGLNLVIPPPTRNAGRPNIEKLLRDVLVQRRGASGSSIGVVVTGPDTMNRSARNTCARLAMQGFDVKVSVEKFGW